MRSISGDNLLYEIYHMAGEKGFVTMARLETETGISGAGLRPVIEDLKAALLIHEHPEGFQVSSSGMHYCKTKWV